MVNESSDKQNKVGIITLYHANYNFGGLLQAYALPNVLKICFGIEAEQIDYIPTEFKTNIEQQKNEKKIYCEVCTKWYIDWGSFSLVRYIRDIYTKENKLLILL